ncbi:hypothetical protein VPH35_020080 [Triticum aestivum]
MPADLSRWVMQIYDPDSECVIVPGRGEIPVTAESVHHTLGLRNSGEEVFYGWDAEAISFINSKFGFQNGADDDFMRAWLIVVVCTFMCPTTSLHVSARCYPIVTDLEKVKRLNFCAFIVNQIKASLGGSNKKKAINCCVHHMVVSTTC